MNSHLAAAHIVPTTSTEHADELAFVPQQGGDHQPVTGWHALQGLAIGILRGLAPGTDVEVCVEQVVEEATDLAVADRVAWILSGRTGRQHVVLAAATGYLVATLTPELDWAAAMRLEPGEYSPRIVSVATADGVLPILLPIAG
jgi:hypothetical protein